MTILKEKVEGGQTDRQTEIRERKRKLYIYVNHYNIQLQITCQIQESISLHLSSQF